MSTISPSTTICRRCRVNPVLAVNLCQRCGLAEAAVERRRRNRLERREQAQERRVRRLATPAWPAEPEDAA